MLLGKKPKTIQKPSLLSLSLEDREDDFSMKFHNLSDHILQQVMGAPICSYLEIVYQRSYRAKELQFAPICS